MLEEIVPGKQYAIVHHDDDHEIIQFTVGQLIHSHEKCANAFRTYEFFFEDETTLRGIYYIYRNEEGGQWDDYDHFIQYTSKDGQVNKISVQYVAKFRWES